MEVLPNSLKGFALLKGDSSKETNAVICACVLNNIQYMHFTNASEVSNEWVPCTTVERTLQILGRDVKPEYYPEWVSAHLHRKIWEGNDWPLGKRVFVKPSDTYKRFTGFVTTGGYHKKKRGPYIFSDVVSFVEEWRYYIANGEVLTCGWYDGEEIEVECPELPMKIPENVCCALDMGRLKTGELAVVEVQHPFACGYYGRLQPKECLKYCQWLAYGWESLVKI